MAEIAIRIKNIDQIRRAFKLAPFTMTKELNLAIRKSIFTIGRQSRINTPVRTGRLRASTYEKFYNLQGEVGTNTTYDYFVHEGTKYMRARPYLRQAVESEAQTVEGYFEKAVQNALEVIGFNV